MDASAEAPTTDRGAPAARPRVTTGRRLLVAFSALVCAFGGALGFTAHRLHAIQAALDAMRTHEERTQLALELESAVRDAVGHQAQIAVGEHIRLDDYFEARARARDLERTLPPIVVDREAREWVADVLVACAELFQVLDASVYAALRAGTTPAGDKRHALVLRIEDRLDSLVEQEHEAAMALRASVAEAQRSTLRWFAAFAVLAFAFAAAVGVYIQRSVARPVARLGAGAARLAEGELGTRIAMDSPDEFGALAAQFNAMSESLQHHQEQLVRSEKLAGVGRLAAGVAHELNNPLSVILGYVMIHRRRAEGRLARDLAAVEQEALRCREIVQDLVELARPDGVRGARPVDLRPLCDEVVTALAAAGQLAPRQVVIAGDAVAIGSAQKVRQVLVNLLRNAAEAAGPGGVVEVHVREGSGAAEVAVADTGPGIPADARDRLFEPFFTTKPTGTGLGLAVSRAIARAHGGDLAVAERREGGACFTLTLPLAGARSTTWQTASSSSTIGQA